MAHFFGKFYICFYFYSTLNFFEHFFENNNPSISYQLILEQKCYTFFVKNNISLYTKLISKVF